MKKESRNVVWEHRNNGGRFYTSYDPEKTYGDNEHHLIVAKDVSDEMALELCHERANQNASAFLDDLPEELRDPKMDNEIRAMIGADEVHEKNNCFDMDKMPDDAPIPHIPSEGQSDERKMTNFELLADANLLTVAPIIYTEPEDNIVFNVGEHKEILKLCGNGDIFVKGKLVENDKEVVDGMRAMIKEFTGLK